MAKYALILISILLIVGCAGRTVCRHEVMREVAWAVEQKYKVRVTVYESPSVFYNAHAQAQVLLDGRWQWVTNWMGLITISDNPDLYRSGYEVHFTPNEYLEMIHKGYYNIK